MNFFVHKILIFGSFLLLSCTQSPVTVENKALNKTVASGSSSANPFKVKAKSGDTLYNISKQYGVGIRDLIELNRLRPPYVLENDQYIRLPQATFHMVQPRDTLYAISRSYGVDMGRVVHLNHLSEPYVIKSGMKLLLPSAAYDTQIVENDGEEKPVQSQSVAENTDNHLRDVVATELEPINAKPEKPVEPTEAQKELAESIRLADESAKPMVKPDEAIPENQAKQVKQNRETESEPLELPSKKLTQKEASQNPDTNKKEIVVPAAFTKAIPKEATVAKADSPVTKDIAKAKINEKEITPVAKPVQVADAKLPNDSRIIEPVLKPSLKDSGVETKAAGKTIFVQKDQESMGFLWPTKGTVVSGFGPKKGGLYNDGINIAAKEGASIKAADKGEVVYSGNELRGYGNLVLVKHPNGFVTAYAHAQKIVVKKGDAVEKGQTIAYVGSTGHVSKPQLHFSIRKGRKAIDPQKYLPVG